ncbi:MAG: hypothetical protein P8P26_03370 [Porticoccaceae bacterium]|jgi:hypothetical protein|nr:hypothetical protein [Porticoccaceae bacterium]MDG1311081.1 hypothetical protein [Porticoccaceae bacterium]
MLKTKLDKTVIRLSAAILLLAILSGCSSSASVQINNDFPTVLAEPQPVSASIVFDKSFSTYIAEPNKNTVIDIGTAQVKLLSNAFTGLFNEVEFVTSTEEISGANSLVIIPSVREVQISTPSDNYLNVFEVWIKYNLEIQTSSGETIDSWFMPAYGKTPDAFMASKSNAIEEASIIALRDAGAKLMLDFYRIPAIYGWMMEQKILEESK